MNKMRPRLAQPLFSKQYGQHYANAPQDPLLFHFIRAYDAIYNLMYYPKDMASKDILDNGDINLDALGAALETAFGAVIFDVPKAQDDGQLAFDLDGHDAKPT